MPIAVDVRQRHGVRRMQCLLEKALMEFNLASSQWRSVRSKGVPHPPDQIILIAVVLVAVEPKRLSSSDCGVSCMGVLLVVSARLRNKSETS